MKEMVYRFYKVSSGGVVWSRLLMGGRNNSLGEWRQLECSPVKSGHIRVVVRGDDGLDRRVFVHVLVLEAFIGPCPEGLECLHGDGNPANNNLDNLRWGTRAENIADSKRHGTFGVGERSSSAKLRDSDIPEVVQLLRAGVPQRQIASRFGVSQPTISAVNSGSRWRKLDEGIQQTAGAHSLDGAR